MTPVAAGKETSMEYRTYKTIAEIENAPIMDLIRHYGSMEALEKDMAVIRAMELTRGAQATRLADLLDPLNGDGDPMDRLPLL